MTGRTRFSRWIGLVLVALAMACAGEEAANDAGGEVAEEIEEPKLMPEPTPVRYPPALWDREVEGETEVLVHVNEIGDVVQTSVAQSSGYAEFDSAAVEGARKLRFAPAKRGDKPVAMRVRIPVRFTRDSTATVGAPRPAGARND